MAITLENRKQSTENGRKPEAGFALLIAVIFMSVMLSFGLALGSLGYKQQVLASSALESQYAFYAADAALECALYADQQQGTFAYANYDPNFPPTMSCAGATYQVPTVSYVGERWISKVSLPIDNSRCADVTIYKYSTSETYLFSQGYDVSCATVARSATNGARFVSRGLSTHYSGSSSQALTQVASENQPFTVPANTWVWYGVNPMTDLKFNKRFFLSGGTFTCNNTEFPPDPESGATKYCWE